MKPTKDTSCGSAFRGTQISLVPKPKPKPNQDLYGWGLHVIPVLGSSNRKTCRDTRWQLQSREFFEPKEDSVRSWSFLPGWLSCMVLLLHCDSPTIATILAPRLDRRFLVEERLAESELPPLLFSILYISPLMLELRTTFLAAELLVSPFSMATWRDLTGCGPAGWSCKRRPGDMK